MPHGPHLPPRVCWVPPTADTPPGLWPASSPASGPVGLGSPPEPWGHKWGRGWAARLPGPPEEGAGCVDRGHAPALPPPGRPGAPRAGGLRTWALRPPPAWIPGRCAGPHGLTPARGTARVRAEGGGTGLRLTLALADDLQEPACCLPTLCPCPGPISWTSASSPSPTPTTICREPSARLSSTWGWHVSWTLRVSPARRQPGFPPGGLPNPVLPPHSTATSSQSPRSFQI